MEKKKKTSQFLLVILIAIILAIIYFLFFMVKLDKEQIICFEEIAEEKCEGWEGFDKIIIIPDKIEDSEYICNNGLVRGFTIKELNKCGIEIEE